MELPPALRAALDRALVGFSSTQLARDSETLSQRYRAETRDGALHLADERAVAAYCAARLPATYAAIRAALEQASLAQPDFAPSSQLDVGAGPGTAFWAARDCWPSIGDVTLIEASDAARRMGERLLRDDATARCAWIAGDATRGLADAPTADLVTLAYVLDELAPDARVNLIDRLWALTKETFVIVEPGTPAGWRRILDARAQLIAAGAHLVAPCAHAAPCPLVEPDWCHFSRRVARSRLHRLTKRGEVPWEDEKFIHLAASRRPGVAIASRVIAPPRGASGRVALKLCEADGSAPEKLITRRDGDSFKQARRAVWGDSFPP